MCLMCVLACWFVCSFVCDKLLFVLFVCFCVCMFVCVGVCVCVPFNHTLGNAQQAREILPSRLMMYIPGEITHMFVCLFVCLFVRVCACRQCAMLVLVSHQSMTGFSFDVECLGKVSMLSTVPFLPCCQVLVSFFVSLIAFILFARTLYTILHTFESLSCMCEGLQTCTLECCSVKWPLWRRSSSCSCERWSSSTCAYDVITMHTYLPSNLPTYLLTYIQTQI